MPYGRERFFKGVALGPASRHDPEDAPLRLVDEPRGLSILQAALEAGRVVAIMCAGRAGTGGAPSGGGRSHPPNGRAAARRPHRERPAPAVTAADWPALAPDVAAALERGPLADRPRRWHLDRP